MESIDEFRIKMTKARNQKKLSKSDLARMISKSPSFICDIESKRKKPSLDTIVDIAKTLEISLDKIFIKNLPL